VRQNIHYRNAHKDIIQKKNAITHASITFKIDSNTRLMIPPMSLRSDGGGGDARYQEEGRTLFTVLAGRVKQEGNDHWARHRGGLCDRIDRLHDGLRVGEGAGGTAVGRDVAEVEGVDKRI